MHNKTSPRCYLSPSLVVRQVGNDFLYLNSNVPSWILVNRTGKEILELFATPRPVSEVVQELRRKFSQSPNITGEDISCILSKAQEKQILLSDGAEPAQRQIRTPEKLAFLWIHVTEACNLRCAHCDSSPNGIENELNTEEICQILRQFLILGGEALVFTGGEPLLRKDLFEIINYARHIGVNHLMLLTNGVLITEDIARKLRKLQVGVQVSLDGAYSQTHETIRGKGSWVGAMNGIRKLVRHKVETSIGFTVMAANKDQIQSLICLAQKLQVKSISFEFILKKGRARDCWESVRLGDEDFENAICTIMQVASEGRTRVLNETITKIEMMCRRKFDFCDAGTTMLSIGSNGDVYPCDFLHDRKFCAGNVIMKDLGEIWKESEVLSEIRHLSVSIIPGCNVCELRSICGGGCMAETHHVFGETCRPSPRCNSLKRIYWRFLENIPKREW